MKFIEIKDDPRLMSRATHRHVMRHDVVAFLQGFLASGIKFAKVELKPGEYSDVTSARSALHITAEKYKMPVEVITRDSVVYLVRTDIR